MPLIRSVSQPDCDLRSFYEQTDGLEAHWIESHKSVIKLIDELDGFLEKTTVWGLTSDFHLNLMSAPEYDQGPCYVTVHEAFFGVYYLSYLMPEETAPFPEARVHFAASGVDEATKYIVIAMRESGGWPDMPELAQV